MLVFNYPEPFESEGVWGIEHGRKNKRRTDYVGSQYWAEEILMWKFWLIKPKVVRIL